MSGGHDGPLYGLGTAFSYWARAVEHDFEGFLAVMKLAYELRALTRFRRDVVDDLLEQLEHVEEPPWPALRNALKSRIETLEREAA